MHRIPCPKCTIIGPYFIIEITDDYIMLKCPECGREFAITAAQDMEK